MIPFNDHETYWKTHNGKETEMEGLTDRIDSAELLGTLQYNPYQEGESEGLVREESPVRNLNPCRAH